MSRVFLTASIMAGAVMAFQYHQLQLMRHDLKAAEFAAEQAREVAGWQAQALGEQSAIQSTLRVIGDRTAQLQAALSTQSAQLRQGFTELKRDDEQVRAYLSGLVPAALGLRYARPATTDPIAWRSAAAGVQPDAVPAAGSPGSSRQ